jgi:Phosphotransferase enzyme family
VASASGRLRDAVAEAITAQLSGQIDESELPRDVAVRLTADRLVREALAAGHAGEAQVAAVQEFSAGNTAVLVARLDTRISYVVKVDTSEALVSEAYLLRRMATDPSLPSATRAAFPKVYAIDETPPIFGYLMEDLANYTPMNVTVREDPGAAADLLVGVWRDVLEPAYRSTRQARRAHELHDDYFGRALTRLAGAAAAGVMPKPDRPLVVEAGDRSFELPDGWGNALAAASDRLPEVRPGFGTWVHGDPNPENVLWSRKATGTFEYRLLDPKDWWTGDYLFDVAKLGHYVVVTAPCEAGLGATTVTERQDSTVITMVSAGVEPARGIEAALLAEVGRFAEDVGDQNWASRYLLAFAGNLLAIAGPRAERALATGSPAQLNLAWTAMGHGLATISDYDARS